MISVHDIFGKIIRAQSTGVSRVGTNFDQEGTKRGAQEELCGLEKCLPSNMGIDRNGHSAKYPFPRHLFSSAAMNLALSPTGFRRQ
jgi:hypothetical protein